MKKRVVSVLLIIALLVAVGIVTAQADPATIIAEAKNFRAIPAAKAMLEKMGFDVGYPSFPMKRYDEETKTALFEAVKKAGLFSL